MKTSGCKLTVVAATVTLIGQFVGASMLSTGANAADMLGNSQHQSTEVEFGTGWYLRGDVGGGVAEVETTLNFIDGTADLGTPLSFGFGAGREFSEGYRLEGQFNQFNNLAFDSRTIHPDCGVEDDDSNAITPPIAVTGTCFFSSNARIKASTLMANAYWDIGKFGNITPYIGGGAGIAYVAWNNFAWTEHCVGTQTIDCGMDGGIGLFTRGSGQYTTENSFTWAANLMVGASYDISRELKLDVGYRYTYIGESGVARAADNSGNINSFTAGAADVHEVRLGLRYEIW